jgi:predicted ABC-type ATPase
VPSLYIIAGPNGAGKTTFIKRFAPRELALLDFINADEIARGLSPFAPERALLEAGRLVLTRFRQFVADGRDFVLETTLSGKTYRNLFADARSVGYSIQLDFLMLPTVEHSQRRVARRVLSGGHNVPDADLRRRFAVSLRNLFTIYRPVLDYWRLHASSVGRPRLLAHGSAAALTVEDQPAFAKVIADFNLPL